MRKCLKKKFYFTRMSVFLRNRAFLINKYILLSNHIAHVRQLSFIFFGSIYILVFSRCYAIATSSLVFIYHKKKRKTTTTDKNHLATASDIIFSAGTEFTTQLYTMGLSFFTYSCIRTAQQSALI